MDRSKANEHYRALKVGHLDREYEHRCLSLGEIGELKEMQQ